jgi:hypothetical protein
VFYPVYNEWVGIGLVHVAPYGNVLRKAGFLVGESTPVLGKIVTPCNFSDFLSSMSGEVLARVPETRKGSSDPAEFVLGSDPELVDLRRWWQEQWGYARARALAKVDAEGKVFCVSPESVVSDLSFIGAHHPNEVTAEAASRFATIFETVSPLFSLDENGIPFSLTMTNVPENPWTGRAQHELLVSGRETARSIVVFGNAANEPLLALYEISGHNGIQEISPPLSIRERSASVERCLPVELVELLDGRARREPFGNSTRHFSDDDMFPSHGGRSMER